MPFGLALLPDLGGAASLDHEHHLLVEMPLGVERAGAGDLDHVHAPQPFGAEELDIGTAPAKPRPRLHRQVLYAPDTDAAEDRHTLGLHEAVIRHRLAPELAEAG